VPAPLFITCPLPARSWLLLDACPRWWHVRLAEYGSMTICEVNVFSLIGLLSLLAHSFADGHERTVSVSMRAVRTARGCTYAKRIACPGARPVKPSLIGRRSCQLLRLRLCLFERCNLGAFKHYIRAAKAGCLDRNNASIDFQRTHKQKRKTTTDRSRS
jgi:hypothetical protein